MISADDINLHVNIDTSDNAHDTIIYIAQSAGWDETLRKLYSCENYTCKSDQLSCVICKRMSKLYVLSL